MGFVRFTLGGVSKKTSCKKAAYLAYHVVRPSDFDNLSPEAMKRFQKELNQRSYYTKKWHKGRYDSGHAYRMKKLYGPISSDIEKVIDMPLSTLVDLSKIRAR